MATANLSRWSSSTSLSEASTGLFTRSWLTILMKTFRPDAFSDVLITNPVLCRIERLFAKAQESCRKSCNEKEEISLT
jgi:hypothetical protein